MVCQHVGDVHCLKIRAGAVQQPKARTGQTSTEQVALLLVEIRQIPVMAGMLRVRLQPCQIVGQTVLRWRVDRKHAELVNLAKFAHQGFGGHHGTHFPTCDMEGLAKAGHHEGALRQRRVAQHALVRLAVEHHVFVHLVTEQQDVRGRQQGLQLLHLGIGPDAAAGVVRRVDDQQPGAWRDRCGNARKIRDEGGGRRCSKPVPAAARCVVRGVARSAARDAGRGWGQWDAVLPFGCCSRGWRVLRPLPWWA